MLEWIGYSCALLIGISLGMIGGGGSVLSVPVLVYLMGVTPVMATAYSLFVVGSSSLVGSLRFAKLKLLDYRIALIFGAPSLAAVFLTRKFLVPAIPESIFQMGDFVLTKGAMLMLLFSLIMVAASYSMIVDRKKGSKEKAEERPLWLFALIVMLEGFAVGTVTGLVGAGGGFLIIPALVVFAGLEMKKAIGTSLLIISIKSLVGFLGDVSNYEIDWTLLGIFTVLAIGGIFIGTSLSKRIDGAKLKKGFGWFVLIMGFAILVTEIFR
jgi:uncharacterized protein